MSNNRKAQECIGKTFGRLKVYSVDWRTQNKNTVAWASCLCTCGNEIAVRVANLKNGTTKSCGCLRYETSSARIGAMIAANKSNGTIREPKLGSAAKVYRSANYNDGNIAFEKFLELSQQDCFYCGESPSNCANAYKNQKFYSPERIEQGDFIYNGLDRLDSTAKHDIENVVPCCWNCNAAKLKRSKEDFLNWIAKVYKLHFK